MPVQDCATRISEFGGAALFIDYGDDFAPTDSFEASRNMNFAVLFTDLVKSISPLMLILQHYVERLHITMILSFEV